MVRRFRFGFAVFVSLMTAACGSSNTDVSAGSGNSLQPGVAEPDGHQAAQASFESGDNAATNDSTSGSAAQSSAHALYAAIDPRLQHTTLPSARDDRRRLTNQDGISNELSALFTVQGCVASFDGEVVIGADGADGADGASVDGNITFNPNGCTRSRKLSGSAALQAAIAGTARRVAITESLTQTLVNGDMVQITSALAGQPTYLLTASGLPEQGNSVLNITVAEHRHRLASTGNVVFDVTIATDANAPLQVVNHYGEEVAAVIGNTAIQARTIVTGVNTVTHNLAHYTAVHTFNNLHHTLDTCNCPDSGRLKEDVTYSNAALGSYSRIYTFTACGEASVVTTASTHPQVIVGTSQVTWDSCH